MVEECCTNKQYKSGHITFSSKKPVYKAVTIICSKKPAVRNIEPKNIEIEINNLITKCKKERLKQNILESK